MTWSIDGKTVLVTGASSGIGKAAAKEFALAGAKVVMLCRPGAKATDAHREIVSLVAQDRVELLSADLSSQASIRSAIASFLDKHDRLDVLVNNAGVFVQDRKVTVDGYEMTFAINHLAPFLITNLLLDRLRASAPSRIVTVSSGAHLRTTLDFDDLMAEKHWSAMKAYGRSKLANVLFTYELARRLEASGVTANCLHPGVVRTGFARDTKGAFGLFFRIMAPFLLAPEKGARTTVYLVTAPDLQGATGGYYAGGKLASSSPASHDPAAARRLWTESLRLTHLV
jgi:NAD(P)-dependent dehydrogenase (short-subunit alcohol dehydrogenase family)